MANTEPTPTWMLHEIARRFRSRVGETTLVTKLSEPEIATIDMVVSWPPADFTDVLGALRERYLYAVADQLAAWAKDGGRTRFMIQKPLQSGAWEQIVTRDFHPETRQPLGTGFAIRMERYPSGESAPTDQPRWVGSWRVSLLGGRA